MAPVLSSRRRAFGAAVHILLRFSTVLTVALPVFLVGYICFRGIPHLSWALISSEESILTDTPGILPSILNTLYVIVLSLLIVVPLGVGAAVYLTEYAKNRRLVAWIEFAAEILAGIPSIIYALIGIIIFCSALGLQKTLLAGSLTMSIMTLPIIIRTTQESLQTVPRSYREGALGLGSGKWRMIRTVVLPSAADGILTGCILTAGRVIGESAVLLYTAGLSTLMQDFSSLSGLTQASGATLAAALYVYARERADFDTAFAIAVVLLLLAAAINLAALSVGRKLRK